jgi:hypothetical protein
VLDNGYSVLFNHIRHMEVIMDATDLFKKTDIKRLCEVFLSDTAKDDICEHYSYY